MLIKKIMETLENGFATSGKWEDFTKKYRASPTINCNGYLIILEKLQIRREGNHRFLN